jgi:hypothetical protein
MGNASHFPPCVLVCTICFLLRIEIVDQQKCLLLVQQVYLHTMHFDFDSRVTLFSSFVSHRISHHARSKGRLLNLSAPSHQTVLTPADVDLSVSVCDFVSHVIERKT